MPQCPCDTKTKSGPFVLLIVPHHQSRTRHFQKSDLSGETAHAPSYKIAAVSHVSRFRFLHPQKALNANFPEAVLNQTIRLKVDTLSFQYS